MEAITPETSRETFAARLERARSESRELLDLTERDPAQCGLGLPSDEVDAIVAEARAATSADRERAAARARDAVASYLAGAGAAIPPEQIRFATSRISAHALALELCGPGEVLAPSPRHALVDAAAATQSTQVSSYALAFDGVWRLDRRSLERAVTGRTCAVVVGNPSEPAGALVTPDDLTFLERLCASRGLALIGDETFADTVTAPCASVLEATRCVAIQISGLSGACGLAHVGAEWCAVAGPAALVAPALARLDAVAHERGAPDPVPLAIPALLARREPFLSMLRERIAANRALLAAAAVREAPWGLLWGRGGCWAVLEIGIAADEQSLCLALLDDGVAVQPGSAFGLPARGYLVVSLLPPVGAFREALSRLDRSLRAPLLA